MDNLTSIEPQPRIDTLVTTATGSRRRRRTEYSGTVWFGSRPELGSVVVTHTGSARIDTAFFLPDSLPYSPDAARDALIACSIAIQSAESESHQFIDRRAALIPDPRGAAVSWVQVQLLAVTRTPVAVSYRVDVLVWMEDALD